MAITKGLRTQIEALKKRAEKIELEASAVIKELDALELELAAGGIQPQPQGGGGHGEER